MEELKELFERAKHFIDKDRSNKNWTAFKKWAPFDLTYKIMCLNKEDSDKFKKFVDIYIQNMEV